MVDKKILQKRKFGIQAQLLAFLLPVVAIAFLVLIVISYMSSKTSIENKTRELLESEGKTSANEIHAWENQNLAALDTMADNIVSLKLTNEQILSYEDDTIGAYGDFPNGVYITCEDGSIIDASGWEPEGDPTEGAWYTEGIEHETFAFGEPYIDTYTNEYVVTASRCIPSLNGKKQLLQQM